MKVIVVDNFDREGPNAVQQRVVAGPGLSKEAAEKIELELNDGHGMYSEKFYKVVEDDHPLQKDWEP